MNNLNKELWDTQFGFFYYNDHEIFAASQDELDERAQEFAATGINHVITFSITHFRWSFQSGWQFIDRALRKIIKAFHKHGIKVTEHHSANYIFAPRNPAGYKLMQERFSCRNSQLNNWSGFEKDLNINRQAGDNISIASLLQIDGATGKPVYLEHYTAHLMCPNNPDYVRLYLKYLEEHIYPLGVDGIMTDDISVRCACPHCRKLFKESTGYELPETGSDWLDWISEKKSPSFIAWLRFRLESCREFHVKVQEHYSKLGLRMLRPNYMATAVSFTYFECLQNFDDLPTLDWAFQENCFSDIIRYSWPEWLVEAGHRCMVAAGRKIPAMSMFYPDREDTVKFGWALAMNWGQKYLATTHNASVNQNLFEKPLREFENQHSSLLNKATNIATLAFYDSYDNRIVYDGYNSRSAPIISSWIQTCGHHNIPWEMINKNSLEQLDTYDAVILPEVAFLEEKEIKALLAYAENGGKLIVIGNCGTLNKDYLPCESPFKNNSDVIMLERNEYAFPVEKRATLHQRWDKSDAEIRLESDCWRPLNGVEKQERCKIISFLKEHVPECFLLETPNAPEDLLVTAHKAPQGDLALHLVNACGTLTMPPSSDTGHSDPIPFPPIDEFQIKLTGINKYCSSGISSCFLHVPGAPSAISLEFSVTNNEFLLRIPANSFSFYALIQLQFQ